MSGRTRLLAAAAVLVVAGAAGGVVAATGSDDATAAAQDPPATTAPVVAGPLSAVVALNGTLTYRARPDGSPYVAINQARGTYTALPESGDRIGCGDALYRVDDRPVLLLCGAIPAYRDLALGARGRDVRQLNANLHRLGADRGGPVDPHDHDFTWSTRQALARLQRRAGATATGALDRDAVVVLPQAARIAKLAATLGGGARPGAAVAQATSDALEVQVRLDASQQGQVQPGDRAVVTLPGNRSAKGRVSRLGRVARAAGKDGDVAGATIPAAIRLDDRHAARGLDQAPVRAEITTAGVARALSVPVTALVGRTGGGFAVELVRAGGRRALVAVRLGLFDSAGGRVQVTGAVRAGDRVVVPSR
ncbi:efflux RND transporter periplasmic adaptor subunit [Patulibacter defluvii]|uniref:efflux RND transporter periplasmic adaptor subunit n=1 Tax=Patulibacter defluvii TaxID=3095358 RepID=UPI002A75C3E4|nr:efflux RND transporter periplasmic adaptor subunit [Patulibacter sp. DM4]